MIPSNSLSSVILYQPYLYPDSLANTKLLDYEEGGIALNDPSAGLEYQAWTLRLAIDELSGIGTIYISAPNHPESVVISEEGITEISLAFDQNMNPAIGFVQNGEAKLRWFDATIPAYDVITFPAGTTAPKVCLDDKRALETSLSDIIVCYTRDNNLYFRAQRDRFLVEYLLKEGVIGQVLKVGMHQRLRLQIAVGAFE